MLVINVLNTFKAAISLCRGRNVEGQCGIEVAALVTRPTALLELHGAGIKSVHAGKLASCAITNEGEAWTWGCGRAGKLGQGNGDVVKAPTRVESFVGCANITVASLSDQHTLFRDAHGGVWSCGENKEGQCGIGTPYDVLAQQHLKAWQQSMRSSEIFQGASQADKYKRYLQTLLLQQQQQHGSQVGVFKVTSSGSRRSQQQQQVGWGGGMAADGGVHMALGFGGFDVEKYMTSSGLQPGQLHTPTRVGSSHQNLVAAGMGTWLPQEQAPGLADVVDVSAARHFSVAATASGEVWTFGACFNGSLGSESSWSSSPQRVGEELAALLCAAGGAVKVAAGGAFALALTATGKVVVWGKLGGGVLAQAAKTTGAEVAGLPPITAIAAGQQHALLTDGERVWAIGKWLDARGSEAGTASWERPQRVLSLPGQHITQLVAGPHTSAAVTDEGRLYMWGRLLDVHHAEGLERRLHRDVVPEDVNWSWAGFGSDMPARVEGLEGVRGVALGGWHAIVVID